MRYSEMKALEQRRAARRGHAPLSPGAAGNRMPWWMFLVIGLVLLLLAACSSPVYRDTTVTMQTNGPVNIDRYQGLWYEIARFPNRFEEGCVGVTAEYSRNPDGTIKVVNTCREGTLDGPVDVVEGIATAALPEADRLEVSFVPWLPFAKGDYWILFTDYEVAVVGTPSGSVGWVLARTPTLPPERLEAAYDVLRRNGYDLSRITLTLQPPA
ncbi:MAG: lipocalin family protein [Pseudomonadota bacterium]